MTSFALYDRCVANQVVLSLEASVLHSFAVSNRRGVFVYKDESEAIFYMKLKAVTGNGNGQDFVEFLVFGLRQPGPSVTRQLNRLLQRRVRMLAVDALSSVLTKNPHLKWKASDVDFVRSFNKSYQPADDEKDKFSFATDIDYAVPDYLYDPIMLLVYFRQNICGSTFFHRLQEANVEAGSSHSNVSDSLVPNIPVEGDAGAAVPFDPREFSLFYNNSPSPLDPEFQPVCTLTTKGAEYSQKAGTGVAIIEVTLVDRDGLTVQQLDIRQVPNERESTNVPDNAFLRLKKVEKRLMVGQDEKLSKYRIRVSIVDTALDRETLHSWVELSLNQVLIAWVIERHIQGTQLGLSGRKKVIGGDNIGPPNVSLTKTERNSIINILEPGFPQLFDLLGASHDLPHPAIEKLELGGVIKASSVATMALDLLEKCLNGLIRKEIQRSQSHPCELSGMTIIRLSRTQRPTPVSLVWDARQEQAHAMKMESGINSNMQDSPIDCPEYLCFYCFSHYGNDCEESDTVVSPSAMCFREVMVDDKSDGRKGVPFVDALLALRKTNPSSFSRSLLFILSVKRNCRMLMTYNWNPNLWKR